MVYFPLSAKNLNRLSQLFFDQIIIKPGDKKRIGFKSEANETVSHIDLAILEYSPFIAGKLIFDHVLCKILILY